MSAKINMKLQNPTYQTCIDSCNTCCECCEACCTACMSNAEMAGMMYTMHDDVP